MIKILDNRIRQEAILKLIFSWICTQYSACKWKWNFCAVFFLTLRANNVFFISLWREIRFIHNNTRHQNQSDQVGWKGKYGAWWLKWGNILCILYGCIACELKMPCCGLHVRLSFKQAVYSFIQWKLNIVSLFQRKLWCKDVLLLFECEWTDMYV